MVIEMLQTSKRKANEMAIRVLLHLVWKKNYPALEALFKHDLLNKVFEIVVAKKLTKSYNHFSQIIAIALSSSADADLTFS